MRTAAKALVVFLFTVAAVLTGLATVKYVSPLGAAVSTTSAAPYQNLQVEKDLWYVCTPDGWREIQTSAPVRIADVTATPGIHPLVPGPYVLGPFSPAQTFTGKWGKYPSAHCGTNMRGTP